MESFKASLPTKECEGAISQESGRERSAHHRKAEFPAI